MIFFFYLAKLGCSQMLTALFVALSGCSNHTFASTSASSTAQTNSIQNATLQLLKQDLLFIIYPQLWL